MVHVRFKLQASKCAVCSLARFVVRFRMLTGITGSELFGCNAANPQQTPFIDPSRRSIPRWHCLCKIGTASDPQFFSGATTHHFARGASYGNRPSNSDSLSQHVIHEDEHSHWIKAFQTEIRSQQLADDHEAWAAVTGT